VEGSRQTKKEHNLNQQQDFDLGHKLNKANAETKICKGYGAEGTRTGKISMALDYGTNAKHSNEEINVNLTVYLSSDTN
jgi:ribosomal protein S4E